MLLGQSGRFASPSSILTFNSCSILQHLYLESNNKFFADLHFFRGFSKFYENTIFRRRHFVILSIHKSSQGPYMILRGHVRSHIKFSPAFLTFIGDKLQTNRQASKVYIYTYIYIYIYMYIY